MNRTARTHRGLGGFTVFLSAGLFVAMVFLLATLGARGYRAVVDGSASNALERFYSFFLMNKLRAAESSDLVETKTDFGIDILRIMDRTGESLYYTRIYCYNGSLMESLLEEGDVFDPALGEVLCEAESMTAKEENGLIVIRIVGLDGQTFESSFASRG